MAAADAHILVGLTVYGEARGEAIEGKVAVGAVIRRRVQFGRFGGDTYQAVCLAPKQFSCWNPGDPNAAVLVSLAKQLAIEPIPQDPVLRECLYVAAGIISGDLRDNTKGATHYIRRTLWDDVKARPSWAGSMIVTAVVGHHVFMAERP